MDTQAMANVLKKDPGSSRAAAMQSQADSFAASFTRSAAQGNRKAKKAVDGNRNLLSASVALDSINLGRLPTLGLNAIKLEEFDQQDINLFRIQPTTEKMLVAREIEREFKDLGRFEKSNKHVHEKGISTRIDRKGTIRVVNAIPPLKS